jgi:hypothetical protein
MEAPKCRVCGERHWSRVCNDGDQPMKGVTKPVTVTPAVMHEVTKTVTWCKTCGENAVLIEALEDEVAMLKRQLAAYTKAAMTPAERMKKMRASRKKVV